MHQVAIVMYIIFDVFDRWWVCDALKMLVRKTTHGVFKNPILFVTFKKLLI